MEEENFLGKCAIDQYLRGWRESGVVRVGGFSFFHTFSALQTNSSKRIIRCL